MLRWLKQHLIPSLKEDGLIWLAIILFAIWSFASTSARTNHDKNTYQQGYEDGFYDGYWKSQGEHGVY